MLTGEAAFNGEDVTEILASVVKASMNLDLLPANIHPGVRETISRCVQKDLRDRYRDMGDVRFEIQRVFSNPSGVPASMQAIPAAKLRKRPQLGLAWIATVSVLGILLGGMAVWKLKPTKTD